MEKLYCPYCGSLISDGCTCEREAAEYAEALVDELEERQHASGFYAFQDTMEMYRREM